MQDKCAVFGIKSDTSVFNHVYYGLYSMQHRGQESAGIAVDNDGIRVHKGMGLVSEVFRNILLEGNVGIGHVRYSTEGGSKIENAQPLYISYSGGSFALAHNGQILNHAELKKKLEDKGNIFTTSSDTEVIAQIIVQEHLNTGDFVEGIKMAMKELIGSYSLVILYDGKLIAVRDPHGIRPLVYGRLGEGHVFASESCALDVVGAKLERDVKPAEIIVVDDTVKSYHGNRENTSHCMFEYVYFSRPDSIINDVSVYNVRKNLGKTLAKESSVKADIVTPVPDSGITAAIGYSEASGISYSEALIKNRYIGRTFILPEQNQRDVSVKVKLNPIASEINGKKLVLVDDSIVRGTTQKRLIRLLKSTGAKEVHVRISCPPVKHTCPYGIDMQTSEEFIASKKTVEQISKEIGADSLSYISLHGLVTSIGLPADKLCLACLTGNYPVKEKQTKLVG
ncbi:MAG: amidophosphoribosyltransferase [Candidatus Altiarchaeota archaeon]